MLTAASLTKPVSQKMRCAPADMGFIKVLAKAAQIVNMGLHEERFVLVSDKKIGNPAQSLL
jgi:hypothetical protein